MSDHDMFRLRQDMSIMRSNFADCKIKMQQLVAELHSLRVEMGYLRDSIPTTKTQTGGIG